MERYETSQAADPIVSTASNTHRARKMRRRIMDAAAEMIAERGFHDTTMRDLAGKLGMSAASLYHYFPGKEQLIVALQRECFDEVIGRARERLQHVTDPVKRLHAFITNHMTFFVERINLIRVLVLEDACLNKANRSIIREQKREYTAMCESLIRDLSRDADAPEIDERVATFSLFGMMNWVHTWHHRAEDLTGEELANGIARIFLQGYIGTKQPSTVG